MEIKKLTYKILDELNIKSCEGINLKKVANHLNVNLVKTELKDNVSGLFIFKSGKGNILYNKFENTARQRFTIAHELGHFILHKLPVSMTKKELKLYRNSESSTGEIKQEREANAFAAALLMPEKFIHTEIERAPNDTIEAIKFLAKKFKVSEQAMTFRLANLGYNIKDVY